MKIGFLLNDLATERHNYTTVELAMAATHRGHETWLIGVGDFAYDPDGKLRAAGCGPSGTKYRSTEAFLRAIRGGKGRHQRITVSQLDVLMLRNDPAADAERPWAQVAGFTFGELARRHGVLVLNDPGSLADAFNKMYFQHFPESVRPRTLITRDANAIRAFVKKEGGRAVLKPLQGSGGSNVFVLKPGREANLTQIIDAISRDGYVVAQEYLSAAKDGDVRLFLMNGNPLVVNGKIAAFRRKPKHGEMRSNVSVGGKAAKAHVDDTMLQIVETVRPKLIHDGMFLVGLDIVGDKLMEINVFSPGGLGISQTLEGEAFPAAVIQAVERKVQYKQNDDCGIDNKRLATM